MSAESPEQKKVFDFFRQKYDSQEFFAKNELAVYAGWDPEKSTFKTYWSKQFRPLLVPHGEKYRVSQYFKRFATWAKFRDNVLTQNRVLSPGYKPSTFDKLVVFEFFMPLRNEEYLRAALDMLFYKDFVISRLKIFDDAELLKYFPKKDGETQDAYLEGICNWVSDKFVGYSIRHVSGRYRLGNLKSKKEANELTEGGEPYLIDETTAVTTFIIPYGEPHPNTAIPDEKKQNESETETNLLNEANMIRWIFSQLFVQSIIEVVNGEDEIWLLESGVFNRLHIWKSARNTGGED